MSSSPTPAAYAIGPKREIRTDNIASFLFSNPFQHAPNDHVNPITGQVNGQHTFDGQPVPVHRPTLVHAGTGATLSWQRLRGDALRVARHVRALVGDEVPFEGSQRVLIAPRTTVLLCLPNCLAYPALLLGSWAALCTVTCASPLLMPRELAVILGKARPQLLYVIKGEEGEGKMVKALNLIVDGQIDFGDKQVETEAKSWAAHLQACWGVARNEQFGRAEQLPTSQKRVWTVNVGTTFAGGADYYGTGARKDGVPMIRERSDWTNLLVAPQGHRQADELDTVERDAFTIRPLSLQEQSARVALLLWSSGTTGASKGVMLSHRALVANNTNVWLTETSLYGPRRHGGEVWLGVAPWTHVFGLMLILVAAISTGATIIIPPSPRFDLSMCLRMINVYGITQLHVAPPVIVHLRNHILAEQRAGRLEKNVLKSVRRISSGGAPTTYAAVTGIYEGLGKVVHQAYGTTETISSATANAPSYDATHTRAMEEIGSVGLVYGNVEMAIHTTPECRTAEQIAARRADVIRDVEKSGGNARRPHQLHESVPGEIWLRAPSNMLGYYSGREDAPLDEKTTAACVTKDGWYKTGDEGMLDAHGQLWIVGRIKELIKVKGFQVAPVELDATFVRHEEVADAAAVGVREEDASGAEEVCMYVEPHDKSIVGNADKEAALVERLTDYVTQTSAYYKWPKYFVVCHAVIKSPTGKILRKDLHTIRATRHVAPRPSNKARRSGEILAKL